MANHRASEEEIQEASINGYDANPKEVRSPKNLEETLGSSTGEDENAIEAGGWHGTDEDFSSAPSDQSENTKSSVHVAGLNEEESLGRAYAGGIDTEDGGVSEITGRPVEESRDWGKDPIDLKQSDSA